MLSYEVCRRAKPAEAEPWALFLNLVSRDYGEVISKSMQGTTAPSSSSSSAMPASQMVGLLEQRSTAVVNAAPTPLSASAAGERGVMGFKPMVTAVGSSIVEEVIIVRSTVTNRDDRNEQLSGIQENMQFIRQLNELNQEPPKRKQAKRQVKLIPSARRNVDMRNIGELLSSNESHQTLSDLQSSLLRDLCNTGPRWRTNHSIGGCKWTNPAANCHSPCDLLPSQ